MRSTRSSKYDTLADRARACEKASWPARMAASDACALKTSVSPTTRAAGDARAAAARSMTASRAASSVAGGEADALDSASPSPASSRGLLMESRSHRTAICSDSVHACGTGRRANGRTDERTVCMASASALHTTSVPFAKTNALVGGKEGDRVRLASVGRSARVVATLACTASCQGCVGCAASLVCASRCARCLASPRSPSTSNITVSSPSIIAPDFLRCECNERQSKVEAYASAWENEGGGGSSGGRSGGGVVDGEVELARDRNKQVRNGRRRIT
mmetsp:Transcript_1159/g.3577  ORF Transcript_1159/g.3577 Transcript_1159/m.3577 type:complete len:276 (+) Transcript_1159:1219-2046(+)